jgi:ABC-type multidrug transport system ATPase subunit
LRDAPILILDEPTSSIDSRTETIILDALERLSDGRTTFTIAHRLSTISGADRIFVVDRGRLVEAGTHDELVKCDGLYCQLWDVQTGRQRRSQETPWSTPQRDVVAATNVLAEAMRLLLSSGTADLAALADNAAEPDDIRAAARLLAGLTPEQIDALRDLNRGKLATLAAEAIGPPALETAAL